MLSSHQFHPFSLHPAYTLVTSPRSGQILNDLLLNYPYKAEFLLYLDLSTVQIKPKHCIFYILIVTSPYSGLILADLHPNNPL